MSRRMAARMIGIGGTARLSVGSINTTAWPASLAGGMRIIAPALSHKRGNLVLRWSFQRPNERWQRRGLFEPGGGTVRRRRAGLAPAICDGPRGRIGMG